MKVSLLVLENMALASHYRNQNSIELCAYGLSQMTGKCNDLKNVSCPDDCEMH